MPAKPYWLPGHGAPRRRRIEQALQRVKTQPVTDMALGLHTGKVFYGNVGSRERLDFTCTVRP